MSASQTHPEAAPEGMVGMVFNIQRFSIHDGPGIRTTVFLKGCPLSCPWCHNPEGISRDAEVAFSPQLCIGCRACMEACEHGGHAFDEEGHHVYNMDRCSRCGSCVEGCYAGAMERIGEERTAEEVVEVVLRDKPFYDNSGGGITVSGGEPLGQAGFTEALLMLCRRAGVSTAVDTACVGPRGTIERLRPLVDLWLCDVKHMDPERHRELTGSDNGAILDNIRGLCEAGADVLLRLPLVPGVNDDEENLRAVGGFAREIGPVYGVELMPYHRIGQGKYERLGRDYSLVGVPGAAEDDLGRAMSVIREAGADRVICGRTPRL